MTRSRRRRGATLAEVIITCALFTVFLTMIMWLFSRTFLFYRTEEKPARVREAAGVFFHRLSKAVRTCDELLEPDSLTLALKGETVSGLVLRLETPEGQRTVGYRLKERNLEELIYSEEYLPYDPSTQRVLQGPRTICPYVERFEFTLPERRDPSLASLVLVVRPGDDRGDPYTLRTLIHFRGEQ